MALHHILPSFLHPISLQSLRAFPVWYIYMLQKVRLHIPLQTIISSTERGGKGDTFLVTVKLKKYTDATKEMRIDTEVAKFLRILSAYATQSATTMPPPA